MNKSLTALLASLIFIPAAFSADILPCEMAETKLANFFGGSLESVDMGLLKECASHKNICVLTEDGIVSADSIKSIPESRSPSNAGLVQIQDGKQKACLFGLYSGGSAATWMFQGWEVNKKLTEKKRFAKTRLNSDSVPPKELAKWMLKAYDK